MNLSEEQFVWVRRQYNSWKKAKYKLTEVKSVHWDITSGGVNAMANQPYLHGYVRCNGMVEGELDHSGIHGPCPHNIKVCIVKKDNDPEVFNHLLEEAGPKPPKKLDCSSDALRLVGEAGTIHGPELREKLKNLGHREGRIKSVLPRLERKGQLVSKRVGREKVYKLSKK